VADVALVPERLVFHRGRGVAAQQAGHAGDPLAQDGIALVGHRRAALLARPERLHQLADLGVLEVADLGGDAFHRAARNGDRCDQRRVAVPLDDLRGDWVAVQSQLGQHLVLQVRLEVAVRANRPGDLAGCGVVGCGGEAGPVASNLESPAGNLHAHRGGLGVDRMGAAHHHGAGLGAGSSDQRCDKRVGIGNQTRAGGLELEGQPGVHNVAAREAQVEVPALLPYRFGDLADKGDDVMVGGLLDF
jgi:hypothetical protein